MAYASLTDLETRQPVFASGSYSDKAKCLTLQAASRRLDTRLQRSFSLPVSVNASGALTFASNPADGATVTVGSKTYRFKDTPAQANDVQRGASATLSAAALNQTIIEGQSSYYYTGTTVNEDVTSTRSDLVLTLTAFKAGPDGNDLPLSSSSAAVVATTFSGGAREFDQLVLLNIWETTIMLLAGQSNSKLSGGGSRSLVDDLKEQIKMDWAAIEAAACLYDTDGNAFSAREPGILTDCDNYPIADSGDPVLWGHDTERDFDRD